MPIQLAVYRTSALYEEVKLNFETDHKVLGSQWHFSKINIMGTQNSRVVSAGCESTASSTDCIIVYKL